jgi:ATP-dependent RNA helicase DeaD
MTNKTFTDLGLSPELLQAVGKLGYEQPSPIQAESIPLIMSGKNMIGQSMTGSGKTAAFAIPAIEMVDAKEHATQVLILCPTRELAVQVSEECFKLSSFKRGVKSVPVYGGQSYERQIRALREGTQIVIGTPGRLLDHLERRTLKLDKIKLVVLDEADEMLDMGFRDDIKTILEAIENPRQLVCFSATMAKPIMNLITTYAPDLKQVKMEHKALTVPTVEQLSYEVRGMSKTEILTRLIDFYEIKLGVVFCNTKQMVDDLADELMARGYSADRIHGGMSQSQRDAVMNKFRASRIEFLVATDVAARGIDVNDVEAVFNYDLPWDEEDYVHRIGRTGRAGRSGRAISLVAGREIYKLQNIERYTKMRIQKKQPPSLGEIEEKRTNIFFERIRTTLKEGKFQSELPLVDRLLEQGFASTDIACALIQELRKVEGQGTEPAAMPAYEKPESAPHKRGRSSDGRGEGKWRGSRSNRRPSHDGAGNPFFKGKRR